MMFTIIFLSLLFIGIAFLLTEKNARYLLSGYNTLPEKERNKVDIKSYIPFFRKFHLFLGLSLLVAGLILNQLSPNAGGVFLALYPIAAYIFFIWKSREFFKGINSRWNAIGALTLVVVLTGVGGLMITGFREDSLLLKQDALELEGPYGEILTLSEIERIKLVEELPEITFKANGFAMGNIRKGYFSTRNEGKVKLILNSRKAPFILIRKKSGEAIYYSSDEASENTGLYKEIKEALPDVAGREAE